MSIQPVNDSELGSIGPVYRLSPEGSQFSQPVILTWRLSGDDLGKLPLKDITVASEEADGDWIPQPDVEIDAATKTIRAAVAHFSAWTLILYVQVDPKESAVSVVSEPSHDITPSPQHLYSADQSSTKIQAFKRTPSNPISISKVKRIRVNHSQ